MNQISTYRVLLELKYRIKELDEYITKLSWTESPNPDKVQELSDDILNAFDDLEGNLMGLDEDMSLNNEDIVKEILDWHNAEQKQFEVEQRNNTLRLLSGKDIKSISP